MVAWLAGKEWAAETRRGYRSALRSFYGWAYATGRIDHDPAYLLPPIKPPQHVARPTPEALLRTALHEASPRVRMMILLASRLGLRRGEIARLHTSDLSEDLAGWSVLVHGKGDKQRMVPLPDDLAAMLRECPHGWVFPGQIDGHLSPEHVGVLVRRALADSGWSTHTLRHRFATRAYAGSGNLLSVQTLLGHSSPETTHRYVQILQNALRATMAYAPETLTTTF